MTGMTEDDFDFLLDQLVEMRKLSVDDEARSHWWDAFKHVEAPVFQEAVRRMIEEDDHYPSPAHVRSVCRAVVNERLTRAVQPPPPSGLSQEEYSRWEREWRRQIVRGARPEDAQRLALEARSPAPQVTTQGGSGTAIEGRIVDW